MFAARIWSALIFSHLLPTIKSTRTLTGTVPFELILMMVMDIPYTVRLYYGLIRFCLSKKLLYQ